jgi:hypothetical protein
VLVHRPDAKNDVLHGIENKTLDGWDFKGKRIGEFLNKIWAPGRVKYKTNKI